MLSEVVEAQYSSLESILRCERKTYGPEEDAPASSKSEELFHMVFKELTKPSAASPSESGSGSIVVDTDINKEGGRGKGGFAWALPSAVRTHALLEKGPSAVVAGALDDPSLSLHGLPTHMSDLLHVFVTLVKGTSESESESESNVTEGASEGKTDGALQGFIGAQAFLPIYDKLLAPSVLEAHNLWNLGLVQPMPINEDEAKGGVEETAAATAASENALINVEINVEINANEGEGEGEVLTQAEQEAEIRQKAADKAIQKYRKDKERMYRYYERADEDEQSRQMAALAELAYIKAQANYTASTVPVPPTIGGTDSNSNGSISRPLLLPLPLALKGRNYHPETGTGPDVVVDTNDETLLIPIASDESDSLEEPLASDNADNAEKLFDRVAYVIHLGASIDLFAKAHAPSAAVKATTTLWNFLLDQWMSPSDFAVEMMRGKEKKGVFRLLTAVVAALKYLIGQAAVERSSYNLSFSLDRMADDEMSQGSQAEMALSLAKNVTVFSADADPTMSQLVVEELLHSTFT